MDHTTHFFFAAWNTHRSHQKQTRAHGGKCALTSTTHHPQAAGETPSMHEDGSNPARTLGKGCSGMEANAPHHSTRNSAALASRALPPVLEAQVKGLFTQAQSNRGNYRLEKTRWRRRIGSGVLSVFVGNY